MAAMLELSQSETGKSDRSINNNSAAIHIEESSTAIPGLEADGTETWEEEEEELSESIGLLEEILEYQLYHLQVINRATQTDWKWVQMALRWRHAPLIKPSPEILLNRKPTATVVHSGAATPRSARVSGTQTQRDQAIAEMGLLLKTTSKDLSQLPSAGVSKEDNVDRSMTSLARPSQRPLSPLQQQMTSSRPLSPLQQHQQQRASSPRQLMSTQRPMTPPPRSMTPSQRPWTPSPAQLASLLDDASSTPEEATMQKDQLASSDKQQDWSGSESGSKSGADRTPHKHKHGKRRKDLRVNTSSRKSSSTSGFTEPKDKDKDKGFELDDNDKMVDTVDLEFDPYDPFMVYTPVPWKQVEYDRRREMALTGLEAETTVTEAAEGGSATTLDTTIRHASLSSVNADDDTTERAVLHPSEDGA